MTGRLQNKTALVTGASRGLGRAIAELFAAEGCAVVLLDLKAAWAESAASAIEAAGGMAIGLGADVSDRTALQRAIQAGADWWGRLDILVNNAMWNRYEPIAEIAPETMDRMLGVGFEGVVWGIQAAAPLMRECGGGSIVNIASVSALVGIPNGLLYCGIKAGVTGLTRAAAAELGPDNIRVNAIAPSTVATEGVRAMLSEERLRSRAEQTPLGCIATVEDIARAARYLASDDSSFVTGQLLTVDGGLATSFA
jgi:NAD(P)-dependent dehydrogenase (short-subunit alcohol dehydrogenase family)